MPEKLNVISEGFAKIVWETKIDNQVVVEFKDEIEAEQGQKRGVIDGKGIVNNKVSNHLMEYLEDNGIETHFIRQVGEREALCRKVEMLPLKVIVRNIAAGNMCKKLGFSEGEKLTNTVLEYNFNSEVLNDPMVNEYHIFAMGICSPKELDIIAYNAMKVNKLLCDYLKSCGLELIDMKLEFGRIGNRIVLADEISPDTCRFWDSKTKEKLDKDVFRHDMGDVSAAYREIAKRLLVE